MTIDFYKFQGTGNDFVMIDNRKNDFPALSQQQIAFICDRKLGIGADGFIKLNPSEEYDFEMEYYNSDGRISSMCGNGGRCIVAFAAFLGHIKNECSFIAIDGLHEASILSQNNNIYNVSLKMIDVEKVEEKEEGLFLNTGSPHHIKFVESTEKADVFNDGKRIRNEVYGKEGANINFVEIQDKKIKVRTYERGVENETLSCGTGVTACAISTLFHLNKLEENNEVAIDTLGGDLSVKFQFDNINKKYHNIFLQGPATYVFKGSIDI